MVRKSIFAELTKRIRESDEISIDSIPDMELYMDQLLTFLNCRLESVTLKPDSKAFTKTMVNNYTKDRLLIPPKNKKYTKQHILLLILIYHLKDILSISEIKKLFGPILRDITTPDDDVLPLEEIYNIYLRITKTYLDEFSEMFANKLSFFDEITSHLKEEDNVPAAKLFVSVLILIAQANLSKKIAGLIIESYFPAVATDDESAHVAYNIDLDAIFTQPSKNNDASPTHE